MVSSSFSCLRGRKQEVESGPTVSQLADRGSEFTEHTRSHPKRNGTLPVDAANVSLSTFFFPPPFSSGRLFLGLHTERFMSHVTAQRNIPRFLAKGHLPSHRSSLPFFFFVPHNPNSVFWFFFLAGSVGGALRLEMCRRSARDDFANLARLE